MCKKTKRRQISGSYRENLTVKEGRWRKLRNTEDSFILRKNLLISWIINFIAMINNIKSFLFEKEIWLNKSVCWYINIFYCPSLNLLFLLTNLLKILYVCWFLYIEFNPSIEIFCDFLNLIFNSWNEDNFFIIKSLCFPCLNIKQRKNLGFLWVFYDEKLVCQQKENLRFHWKSDSRMT